MNKKTRSAFLTLIVAVVFSSGAFAQSNSYIETVESNIELTKAEKEKLFELKSAHTKEYKSVSKQYKGTSELAAKRKEVGANFYKSLDSAFGSKRATEIRKASRSK